MMTLRCKYVQTEEETFEHNMIIYVMDSTFCQVDLNPSGNNTIQHNAIQ